MTENAERCSNCKFAKIVPVTVNQYNCVRFPAQVIAGPQGPLVLFPQMLADGWCGEWKRKVEILQ